MSRRSRNRRRERRIEEAAAVSAARGSRRADRAVHREISRTAGPRDTFRVARAQRVLAESIPDVVLSTDRRKERRSPARRSLVDDVGPVAVGQRAARPDRAERAERRRDPPLRMDDKKTCHERPKRTRGSGGSRRFAGRYCNRR